MGRLKLTHIPGERPLTIYLDKREIVTLMTLGSAPEALVLGYLRNQRMVESPDDIESIQVDWDTDSAAVKTRRSTVDIDVLTSKRVVTTGCGQGTMFGGLMEEMAQIRLPEGPILSQEAIVSLIESIRSHDTISRLCSFQTLAISSLGVIPSFSARNMMGVPWVSSAPT